MEKKRRKIYRMIDCGHVSELSKEEKEHAMNMLRHDLVHNHFSGDCIGRVEKRAWVIHRRLAMLEGAPPKVSIQCKLQHGLGWHVVPACDTLKWSLSLCECRGLWRLAWIDNCGIEIIIWDFDSYEDAVAWLRGHVIIRDTDGYDGDSFELLLQAIAPYYYKNFRALTKI